jgi:hypothetical protein
MRGRNLRASWRHSSKKKNRFEPVIEFVKEAKQATFLLLEGNPEKKRDFLKKIGSNFQMAEKRLSLDFKNPWKHVSEFTSLPVTALAACGENAINENWRKERDSNPR